MRVKSYFFPRTVNMNRVLFFCFLLWAATPHARADDVWHNVYHGLKRFFTGHRGGSHATSHSKAHVRQHTRTNPEKSEGSSSEPKRMVLPEATPAQVEHPEKPADKKPPEAAPTPNSSPVMRSMPQLS